MVADNGVRCGVLCLRAISSPQSLWILGVVQDQVDLSAFVPGDQLIHKTQKTGSVEPVDEAEVKFWIMADRYCSHHFQGLSCG